MSPSRARRPPSTKEVRNVHSGPTHQLLPATALGSQPMALAPAHLGGDVDAHHGNQAG